ncbi:UNVERIFIED_CONTAM: hypothetical protein Sradi_1371700 [Sesamum radiatum]|uniref:Uncharacterized protein n=1 Tax=Sesamum radiatum TaxID=300843 RepID=A0AAW2UT35_SESRA
MSFYTSLCVTKYPGQVLNTKLIQKWVPTFIPAFTLWVAGLSRGNQAVRASSAFAAIMASLMAKKTAEARKNGGSPTAFDECMALSFQ